MPKVSHGSPRKWNRKQREHEGWHRSGAAANPISCFDQGLADGPVSGEGDLDAYHHHEGECADQSCAIHNASGDDRSTAAAAGAADDGDHARDEHQHGHLEDK